MDLCDKAYDAIKNKIIFENIKNRYISVLSSAKKLDMSYTPVREAFQVLEEEGWLEKIPNVGYLIPKISNTDIDEIFQVRECLETFVLDKVFSLLTVKDSDVLNNYIEEMGENLKNKNEFEFYNTDKKFHMYFFKVYNNSHLIKKIENIRDQNHICSRALMVKGKRMIEKVVQEHRDIVNAIENNNKQEALTSLKNNIICSRQRLKKGSMCI